MKYLDEYRNPEAVQRYLAAIHTITTRPWTIMEICGGQTHSIVRYGLDQLLPRQITLAHGPGCPVCVTPVETIDKALHIAAQPNVIFCSFGDMLRVPGSAGSADAKCRNLLSVKACGGDVRIVYSPLDAVRIAQQNPEKQVVFFAVGFETTAPANAMSVHYAKQHGVANYSVLISHALVPPAMEAILSSPDNCVQGFLAAGHVCTVMGYTEYEPIATKYRVPIVVTGFEPLDLLQGIYMCLLQLEEGRFEVENPYARVVRRQGNQPAQDLIARVFRVVNRKWRGLGEIPQSGLALSDEYADFDAELRFALSQYRAKEDSECISGLIMQGAKKPEECAAYGSRCTPEHPLGAPMVSSEGACAAYYNYRHLRSGNRSVVTEAG
jgi:hydrogenase expression/formation protein HypD